MHQALILNNQRKITYSNSCILFSLLVSMCSIFSIFFLKLKHTSKIICFSFPLSTIAFQVGAPSFCSSLPSNSIPPQGALPYPCQVYPTGWCVHTDWWEWEAHTKCTWLKQHMLHKCSAAFIPSYLNAAKNFIKIYRRSSPGYDCGILKIFKWILK